MNIEFLWSGPVGVGMEHHQDPSRASAHELRWSYFVGDIRIEHGTSAIETSTQLIPALHFGQFLKRARDHEWKTLTYTFTESDAELYLLRRGDTVDVRGDFANESVQCQQGEFIAAADEYMLHVAAHLKRTFPQIASHEAIRSLTTRERF